MVRFSCFRQNNVDQKSKGRAFAMFHVVISPPETGAYFYLCAGNELVKVEVTNFKLNISNIYLINVQHLADLQGFR